MANATLRAFFALDQKPQPVRTVSTVAERSALAFARRHDWGQSAYLYNGTIRGLSDSFTDRMGNLQESEAQRPATIAAMREFGGY